MTNAADIITYVGVPLAILGVTPILYTYLKTMWMGLRLRRTLKTYDIEASVQSRLLSGVVDISVPTYQLTLPPRDRDEYWVHKTTDGSRHGVSWQHLNWLRRPIDEKTLQVHFSDRITLPEASISFSDLIHYLGDLGLQTDPEGFWDLNQKGLNVLPGTCLVREVAGDGSVRPVLVVAKPTVEHPGALLLRFQNTLNRTRRSNGNLDPDWIRVPDYIVSTKEPQIPQPPETTATTAGTSEKVNGAIEEAGLENEEEKLDQEIVEYIRVSRKGVISKRLTTGTILPVMGLPYWFTYSFIASTSRSGVRFYNGRPFGYHFRLEILYFAREFVFAFSTYTQKVSPTHDTWLTLLMEMLSKEKMAAIPQAWTENSDQRIDGPLTKRFELLIDIPMRNRSAKLRRARQRALQIVSKTPVVSDTGIVHLPLEVVCLPLEVWREAASKVAEFVLPLTPERVPTSQEICLAATGNVALATRVAETLEGWYRWFDGDGELVLVGAQQPGPEEMVAFMCAVVVLGSIAEGAGYLAALIDVEECVVKWDPVYLC